MRFILQSEIPVTLAPPIERRRFFLLRTLWSWFLDVDLDTLEKQNINYKFFLSLALLLFGAEVVAVPPPVFQSHYVFVLPAWLWFSFLSLDIVIQIKGRKAKDFCIRAKGALVGFILCGGLLGPLFLRNYSPVLCCFELLLTISEVLLWVRLSRECRCVNKISTT